MSDDYKKRCDAAIATLQECTEALTKYDITDSPEDLVALKAKMAEALTQVEALKNRWTH
jgi:hypothetical protein